MALVALLRGVNIGGHRRLRPSILARQLHKYDVVNLGAAGSFVVWKPLPKSAFLAELQRKLPPDTTVVLCEGREVARLATENPFGSEPPRPDVVRFVSVLEKSSRALPSLPITFPSEGEWLVRLISSQGRFVFGEYRRHMKTIGYLGQIDKLFGTKATTRNWNTILAMVNILSERRG